jgi:hypothetical protein
MRTSFSMAANGRLHLGLGFPQHFEAEGDVLGDRHMREQRIGLEHGVHMAFEGRQMCHLLAFQQDAALGRHLEPGDQAQQGGLAAARRAQQGKELVPGARLFQDAPSPDDS